MTEKNREDAHPRTGMIPVSTGLIAVPTGLVQVPDRIREAGAEIAHSHPGDKLSSARLFGYVLLLGALTALGPFTVDMYLPAFPLLQSEFAASEGAVQLTLTGTMVGFALGQLIVGPLSDIVGRRTPLLISTTLHLFASVIAVFAPSLLVLGGARVLMGKSTSRAARDIA